MPTAIDDFLPHPDVAESHSVTIHAPADLVFETAWRFDLMKLRRVQAISRLREWIMGAHPDKSLPGGLVEMTARLGWRELAFTPGRQLVMGAVAQPWLADVEFRGLAPEEFRGFTTPGFVRIAWTLECEELGPALTLFRTQTRVQATDETSGVQFRRYWRRFGIGIVLIRHLLLPAVRRQAEDAYRSALEVQR